MALLAGLDVTGVEELRVGPSHGGQHLHNLLKFLTMRSEKGTTRSGITLVGGPHDPAIDGPASRFCTSHAHPLCFPDAQRGWHSAGLRYQAFTRGSSCSRLFSCLLQGFVLVQMPKFGNPATCSIN